MITPRRAALIPALCALVLAGCGRSQAELDAINGGANGTAANGGAPLRRMADLPFSRNWDVQLPGPVEAAWIIPQLPDLLVVQLAKTHALMGIDIYSGDTRWATIPLPGRIDPRHPVTGSRSTMTAGGGTAKQATVNEDRIYAVVEDTVFSFDAASGQVVWRMQTPFTPSGGPTAAGGDATLRLFLPDFDGRLQVLTAVPYPRILWQWNMQATIGHPMVEKEGLVYGGDDTGTIRCFKLDREQVWAFHAGGAVQAPPAVRDRVLYVGNDDNILWALNRLSGEELGHLNFNAPIRKAPMIFANEPERVYVVVDRADAEHGGLYAVKTVPDTIPFTENRNRNPREVVRMAVEWHARGLDRCVGSTPDTLFMTKGDSLTVHAVERRTGTVAWTWQPGGEVPLIDGKPDKAHRIVGLIPHQDRDDRIRSLIAVDAGGKIISWRSYGFFEGDTAQKP